MTSILHRSKSSKIIIDFVGISKLFFNSLKCTRSILAPLISFNISRTGFILLILLPIFTTADALSSPIYFPIYFSVICEETKL